LLAPVQNLRSSPEITDPLVRFENVYLKWF
jgi:hypothetical protein